MDELLTDIKFSEYLKYINIGQHKCFQQVDPIQYLLT